MTHYVTETGHMVDSAGNYLLDEFGDPLTEAEYDSIVEQADAFTEQGQAAFAESIRPAYHRLEMALGREPTDRELSKLLDYAEETGDPDIDKAYESVVGRSPDLSSDEERLQVMAEIVEESMAAPDESAEAPGD